MDGAQLACVVNDHGGGTRDDAHSHGIGSDKLIQSGEAETSLLTSILTAKLESTLLYSASGAEANCIYYTTGIFGWIWCSAVTAGRETDIF